MAFDPDAYLASFDPDVYLAAAAPLRRPPRKCSRCHEPGHRADHCDAPDFTIADPIEREILIAHLVERRRSPPPIAPDPPPAPAPPEPAAVDWGWRADVLALTAAEVEDIGGPPVVEPPPEPPPEPVSRSEEETETLSMRGGGRSLTIADVGRIQGPRRSEIRTLLASRTDDGEPATPGIERPRTRGECMGGERPCPWVSCRYHLALDVEPSTGSLKVNFPHLEVWQMRETCALDVADKGGVTLDAAGDCMNVSRERIRQLENRALEHGKDVAKETEFPTEARDVFDDL